MTLSGIIAGLSGTCGAGCALSRVAAGIEATRRSPVREPQTERTQLDVEDRVELSAAATGEEQLTDDQKERVEELKQRDAEVREHEQAHLSAAGGYAHGGAQFEYTTGPDGRRYATGGEVQIDTSAVSDDPDATMRKMQTVQAAALAPAQPSAQDRRVAAYAAAAMQKAQAEKVQAEFEEDDGQGERAASASSLAKQPKCVADACAAQYSASGAARASDIATGPSRLDMHA